MQMIADKIMADGVIDSISDETVKRVYCLHMETPFL